MLMAFGTFPPRPPVPTADLLQLIGKTNINSESQRDGLKSAISSGFLPAYLPFGTYVNGDLYRVVVDTHALVTHTNSSTTRPLLPPYILGVNTNAPSNSTHQKLASNESDDALTGGFTCIQLGQVECFYGADALDPVQCDCWEYTGFCAVISFTSSGRASGIYFIYDFYQVDKCAGMNTDRKERNFDKQLWGLLPNSQVQFSCAKVAEEKDITNLTQDFQFQLSEVSNHEVGLVRAVLTSQNTIIRAEIPVAATEFARHARQGDGG